MLSFCNSGLFSVFWVISLYGTYCQMAPAAAGGAGGAKLFEVGVGWRYLLDTKVILNGIGGGKHVGYHLNSKVNVVAVWNDPNKEGKKLVQLEVKSPVLHIKSRKAPEPEGFVPHSSKLDSMKNTPAFFLWNSGKIEKFYVNAKEDVSLTNFKKGIASMFQFELLDVEVNETDASGECHVTYTSQGPTEFTKTKDYCRDPPQQLKYQLPLVYHSQDILSNKIETKRSAKYIVDRYISHLESVRSEEMVQMNVAVRKDAGCKVTSMQELVLNDDNGKFENSPLSAYNIQDALLKLEQSTGIKLVEDSLVLKKDNLECKDESCMSIVKLVKEYRDSLKEEQLGTIKSAVAFIKVLKAARRANREELTKVLKNSKNKHILLQLYDVMGFTQTEDAHRAAVSTLRFDIGEDTNNIDVDYELAKAERYLWASQSGANPPEQAIRDILSFSEKERLEPKLKETLLLSVAAMANRYAKIPENSARFKVKNTVKDSIINGLDYCKDEDCRLPYIRALKNLQDDSTIPKLLEIAISATRKSSVAAMKSLKSFPKSSWNQDVLKTCRKIFFQLTKKPRDSSARTLALDIILESKPTLEVLKELIYFLRSSDRTYEVKQYLLQRLAMLGENNVSLLQNTRSLIRGDPLLNNYHILGARGLTTAFSREFARNPSHNGSLITIQEINGGLLKRGIVDVTMDSEDNEMQIFSLGLFAGGLSSFISSDDGANGGKIVDEVDDPEDAAHAGMEVTVLGAQVRPFVFFNGQGELMGHVWSGTASEKTPAFQEIALLHDHHEFVRLSSGFIVDLNLLGAASFDLSGQIEMSLWNRNAHSKVEKSAGIVVIGQLRIDSSFVQSQVEFSLSAEPRLSLTSNLDFYSGVALCMQLKQPDTIYKHNVYKIERIPGSKHKLRNSAYQSIRIPGKTYALNRKNNEMCNVIFKNT